MYINVNELRAIIQKLLEWLAADQSDRIELTDRFYWNIPEDQLYNMDHEPIAFDVGKLSDDWHELRKLLDGNRLPIRQQLVWLAALLRALGGQILDTMYHDTNSRCANVYSP